MSIFRVLRAAGLGGALALAMVTSGRASIDAHAQSSSTLFSGQATAVSGRVGVVAERQR